MAAVAPIPTTRTREASRAGRIDAEEFLEDFLFAYGTVADAEEAK